MQMTCPTGEVCLNDATAISTNPCVSSGSNPTPFIFNAPYPPTPETAPQQIRVGVYINDSDGLAGFTVVLNASVSILKPAGVDLTGTVLLGTPVVLAECLSGILVSGSTCGGADTLNTIELSATSAPGMPVTNTPTTGLLFTAIYNVTGTTSSGGIPIGFQANPTYCGTTSVSGNVCISIANGNPSNGLDPETVQTGNTLNNSACLTTCGWYAMTSNVTSTTVLLGATGTGTHVGILAKTEDGGPILGGPSVSFTVVASSGFTPPTLNATSCTPGTTPCGITATVVTSTPGTYDVTVYGSYTGDNCGGGAVVCTTTYSLIGPVTFQVNIGDVGWTVNGQAAGASQTAYFAKGTFSVPYAFQSLGEYTGTISLSQSSCTPGTTGVSCPVALPPAFTLPAGTTVTKLINFTASGYGKLTYKDTMSATSVPSQNQGTLTIIVSGYSLVANATSVTFTSTGVAHLGVTATSLGVSGSFFTGNVVLGSVVSPSTGLTISCPSVSVPAGSAKTGTCILASTTPYKYTLAITGTGGTGSLMANSTAPITVTVNALACQSGTPCFDIKASPASAAVSVSTNATSTIALNATGGFTGTVSLFESSSPSTGLSCTFYPMNVTLGSSGTSTLSCRSTTATTYTLIVNGASGTTGNSTTVTFTFQDFSIAASPTSITQNVGVSGSSTITVSPLNGFTGTVSLSVSTNSTNLSCTLSSMSITGGSGTSSMSCTASAAGGYLATVTGTSGSLSHSVNVTYAIPPPDFTLSTSPTGVTVNAGASGTSTVSVGPLNGFTGTVTLTVTTNSSNLVCTLSSTTISGGSGSSTLSCSGSPTGYYLATVTGTSGTLSHYATVTYQVQDFTVTASPTSISVKSGSQGTSTVTVSAVNGFAGTVTLAVTTNSTSLSCTFSAKSITGGSGTSTLSCSSTVAGSYLAIVKSTSGSLSHIAAITYTVTSTSSGKILGLSSAEFYSLIGVLIGAIIVAAILLLLRRRPGKPAPSQGKTQ
jgi:hypothetical protein